MNALQKQTLKKIAELVNGMHLEEPYIPLDNPNGDERLLGLAEKKREEKTARWWQDKQTKCEILKWVKALNDSE